MSKKIKKNIFFVNIISQAISIEKYNRNTKIIAEF